MGMLALSFFLLIGIRSGCVCRPLGIGLMILLNGISGLDIFRPLETAPYARDFMKLLALEPGESVLDMGCGAGSIAIPLAQDGIL